MIIIKSKPSNSFEIKERIFIYKIQLLFEFSKISLLLLFDGYILPMKTLDLSSVN